ncbi:hypothetical protein QWY14_07720 [Planococcus sp. N028]|uniref:O-antigen ligase family protein n=1 Tax=Planococcus shixiaomingii TaxID=3058393 RepID=A0ABT8N1B0_9BACL|nr:hypothetical protein [Planococcus sp. N028]MDN7241677.1 hypothetical protein [Planococcus sp. N028]
MGCKENKIKIIHLIIIGIFTTIYILPTDFLKSMGIPADQLLFALIIISYFIYYIFNKKILKYKDIIILLIITYFCFMHESISHIHLISLIIVDKLIMFQKDISRFLYGSRLVLIALLFTFLYSFVYFGFEGRYLYTGLKEVNQSGYAILLLFLLVRAKYRIIGNLLLVLGFLTFSKSYLLGVIIFFSMNTLIRFRVVIIQVFLSKLKDFRIIASLGVLIPIILSIYFTDLYESNSLNPYGQGSERFIIVNDYSNYFRFVTNTNLLKIYEAEPYRLWTGIDTEEFYDLNKDISSSYNQAYREIKPHNYFFSYLRIYGGFSIFLFWYLYTIFRQVVTKKSLSIFLVTGSYVTFLGIGVNTYWLFITIFLILIYNNLPNTVTKQNT